MRGALVVLAALCFAAASASANARSWYGLTTLDLAPFTAEQENLLYVKTDFRGIYGLGSNLAIVVATETEVNDLSVALGTDFKLMTAYAGESETLYVGELEPSQEPNKVLAKNARKIKTFLVTFRGARVLSFSTPYGEGLDLKAVELIPLPSRSIIKGPDAPRTKMASVTVANSDIVAAVASVDRDELYDSVDALSNNFNSRLSIATGADDAQEYLEERFEAYGLEVSTYAFLDNYSSNVIAELPGSVEPDQIIVVGAHYDSRSTDTSDTSLRAPGADDNGSGSSAILELARILSSSNYTFHYTIRFMLFSGEEQGLLGSAAYANEMADEGVSIIAMFNADMLGYRIPGSDITLGFKDRYITEWLLSAATAAINLYVPELPISKSSSCCSDYRSFWNVGYPSIGFFENPTAASNYPSYHTSNDVIGNIDFDQVVLETKALLSTVMTFAVPI